MATIIKTLSTNIAGGNYPATYTWSSDCDSFLTYSNKTGTINSNGLVTTTISFDDTNCLLCNFLIDFNNGSDCYGQQDSKGVQALTCGRLYADIICTNYSASIILNGSTTITINPNQPGIINNVFFGTHNLQIEIFGLTGLDNCIVTVNGQSQTGNGTLFFNVTTDFVTPYIVVGFQCDNC